MDLIHPFATKVPAMKAELALKALTMRSMLDKAVVAMFVRQQCTLHPDDTMTVSKDELFEAFMAWAHRQGREMPNMNTAAFGRYLFAACPKVAPKRCRVNGERVWSYARITLNEY